MRNKFLATVYRFHTKETNKFLLIGYFSKNKMKENKIIFRLDGRELSHEVEEVKRIATLFEEVEGVSITRDYFFWINLPEDWEQGEKLEVYNSVDDEQELAMIIPKEELLRVKHRIPKSVDQVFCHRGGFTIKGWYFQDGDTKIQFQTKRGRILKVKISSINRIDVMRIYPETNVRKIVGYSAFYKGIPPQKVKVIFQKGEQKETELVQLYDRSGEVLFREAKIWIRKIKDYYRQFGLKASLIRTWEKLTGKQNNVYSLWVKKYWPTEAMLQKQRKTTFSYMPKISIVVPLYKTPEKYLREMIESVEKQTYKNWELCLSDGSGEHSPIEDILKEYTKKDARIRVTYAGKQMHISENTNEALKIATGDYIAFLDHDDLLAPNALYENVSVINEDTKAELIYSDEDKVNMDGTVYFAPHFKSDFNLDMLRGTNYICHFTVVKKELFQKVGMLRSGFDGSQDYDFVLRCIEQTEHIRHIPKVLYHWRAHENSTASASDTKSYASVAGLKALREHYERVGIDAQAEHTQVPGMYRSRYALKEKPLVSIIIPNKDHTEDLEKCIQSIETKSTYKNIEYIIVENNSTDLETFEFYKELEASNPRVKVIYWEGKGFNYPAINNYGVEHANGDYLLLLNNDTEIINEDCIEELMSFCMREDVGAVGARLYYPDGNIQHAGVIIGLGGVAGHSFLDEAHGELGYFGRAIIAQDLSAVTAACMMVKKSVYMEVGGLDEGFAVAFNDVDLCLKIREAGYLIVYNPYAELTHYESKSRGYDDTDEKRARNMMEIRYFQERWGDFLEKGDPYYSPNLTVAKHDFSIKL